MHGKIAAATLVALLCGCESAVTITSEPSGARVWIDGVERGATPVTTTVEWKGWDRNHIVLQHPDCHPFSTTLQRTLRWFADSKVSAWMGVAGIYTYGLGFILFVRPIEQQHFVLAPLIPPAGGSAPRSGSPSDGSAGDKDRSETPDFQGGAR
jgi:hypothetical protein